MLDADGRPLGFAWNYSRAEMVADGVVHALGVSLGLAGAIALLVLAAESAERSHVAAAAVYAAALLAVLGCSAAYNMWPVSRWKWRLRRFDHAAIYLLIAGTYTPFLLEMPGDRVSLGLLAGIWTTAVLGMALKLFLPGCFDRLSIGAYLLLGWSGVLVYDGISRVLPASTLTLLALGGALYSAGVIFHVWQRLRFQNAIWHAFVLAAAVLHYVAVLDTVALAGG